MEANQPTDSTYELLNNEHLSDAEKRSALIQHIREYAALFDSPEHRAEDIAYHLAGLMSTRYVMGLEDDDPIDTVLTLAGELELPEAHRNKESTWRRLLELVDDLH